MIEELGRLQDLNKERNDNDKQFVDEEIKIIRDYS